MITTTLSIGSNINAIENITSAISELKKIGEIEKISSYYKTSPVGKVFQPVFINLVLQMNFNQDYSLSFVSNLINIIKNIEKKSGRKQRIKWGPRELDIDILTVNNYIINSDIITIPHKYINFRKFVLIPLKEIVPDFIHPVTGINIDQIIMNISKNDQIVRKIIK